MYEYAESHAWDIARHIGAQIRQKGRELFFQECPYCRGGARKDRETFSISLDTGKYKCFRASCGVKGNIITLARDFDFPLPGDDWREPRKTYREFKTPAKPIIPKPAAVRYLESRGISEAVARRYEITTQKGRDNILVFPFFDDKGSLKFVKYRKTDYDKSVDKAKEWCEKDCMPILFGMRQCSKGGRMVLTEGQIDSLSVAEAGIENAVSVPTGAKGFTWVPNCWDFVKGFDEIVVFGDCEKGEITLLAEISRRFSGKVRHVRECDYLGCKDANELLQKHGRDAVRNAVNQAVCVPMYGIVDLAEVESVNPGEIEKLKTGILDLDICLRGGLPFGYYHVITGRRGEGKSTLASQMLAEALRQGHTVFAYSGELPVGHFKSWIDFQIAGPRHIWEKPGDFGKVSYYISAADKDRIADWYRGKIYAFDSERARDAMKVVDMVDEVIRRYGARVVLIDNLMTAVDLDKDARANKYDAQGEFAKRLAEIARKYNALILLVAHRRKQQTAGWLDGDPNDDIGGSSYVTNLAGDIIGYARPDSKMVESGKATEDDRILTVTKNRLFGAVNYRGWLVNFNERSKRIGGARDDFNRQFGWEEDGGGFELATDNPFK